MDQKILYTLQRINAIASAGLHYGKDTFDLDRYEELKVVTAELLEILTGEGKETIDSSMKFFEKYETPSVDVRAFVLKEDKILFVKDKRDSKWSLPGGYAEVGLNLQENVLKELLEEAGVSGYIERLLAIFDTNKYNPQFIQYYKTVFLVRAESIDFQENNETEEVGFFGLNELPQLSKLRNTEEQVKILYDLYINGEILID